MNSNCKIAFVIPGLDPTGPVFIVKSLVSVLVSWKYYVVVYYLKHRINEMSFDCETIKLDKKESIDFGYYDIVHSHCFSADRFVYKNRKHLGNAKWISTIHQDTFASLNFKYPKFISKSIGKYWLFLQNHAHAIVAISNQVKNTYQKYVTKDIITIYNGINTEIDKNDSEKRKKIIESVRNIKKKSGRIIGTSANIVKRKGLDQVLDCMIINKSFDFVIIGDGEYKHHLEKRVEELELTDRVHFFPFVASPAVCLEDVDVYVMPSYSEGFGLALLESAYEGKPIVCSNIPSFHELFTFSEAVFFDLDDIKSLSDGINRAFIYRNDYAQKARNKAMLFTKENMTKKHIDLYSLLQK